MFKNNWTWSQELRKYCLLIRKLRIRKIINSKILIKYKKLF